MRQMRRLPNGNTLICASTEDEVIEVAPDKSIVWRYKLPFPYLATRLDNGNTLISSGTGYGSPVGYFLVEVDPKGPGRLEIRRRRCPVRPAAEVALGLRPPRRMALTYISEAQNAAIRVVARTSRPSASSRARR